MNTIGPFIKQVCDFFNYMTHDYNFTEDLKYKGGVQGNEWHTKVLNHSIHEIRDEYKELDRRFSKDPFVSDVLGDNFLRVTVLAGLERLITLRQGQTFLADRFAYNYSNNSILTGMFQQGFFKGYFRGFGLNLLQFFAIPYHSLFYCRGKDLKNHLIYASLLESFFYPLDTLKTIIYADIGGKYKGYRDCLNDILGQNGIKHLYRGLKLKLIYNAAFLWNLRNSYDGNSQLISLPVWLASYALLTFKTRLQISDTKVSFQSVKNNLAFVVRCVKQDSLITWYAGFVPFVALNLLFQYSLKGLYSEDRKRQEIEGLKSRLELIGNKKDFNGNI